MVRVDSILLTPCVEWPLSLNPAGYGQKMVRGKLWRAHRWVWTQANGPIPEGMQVNHHCDNRACVNVEHLYLGTQKDNMRDALERGRMRPAGDMWRNKTHCPKGHPIDGKRKTPKGGPARYCLTCHRDRNREYMRRKARERKAG